MMTQHARPFPRAVPVILWGVGVFAVVGCDGDNRAVHSPVASVTSVEWPNEPVGFDTISDYGFDDPIPQTSGDNSLEVGSGWWIVANNDGNTTRQEASDPPFSSPRVAQFLYPVNFPQGSAPGTLFLSHPDAKEVYAGFWWKPSSPWEGDASWVNKLGFWATDQADFSAIIIQMYGPNGGPYRLDVVSEFVGAPVRRMSPNVTTTDVSLGVWHQVEWYMKYAAVPGGSDGLVKWWLDGVLQASYTDLQTPADPGFNMFQFSPTWGGFGDNTHKAEPDTFLFDHVHLSQVHN